MLADSEANVRYRMFRRSTPISPLKYSAVNVVVMGIYIVIGTALAVGLTALFCAVSGTAFTQSQLASIFFCAELVLVFAVLTQLEQAFRRLPKDKASMIVVFTIMLPLVLLFLFFTITGMELDITIEKIIGLYRIIIFVQLRCQIFRQIVQIECRRAGARQTKFVQDDGKDASKRMKKALAVNYAVLP